jgi:hypothetical protein
MIHKDVCVKQGDLRRDEPEFKPLRPKSRAVKESERP